MTSITGESAQDLTKAKLSVPVVWHLITVITAVLLAYAAVTDRLAKVETKVGASEGRMERIERSIDRVDSKLDQLLQRVPR